MYKHQIHMAQAGKPSIAYRRADDDRFPLTGTMIFHGLIIGFLATIALAYMFSPIGRALSTLAF